MNVVHDENGIPEENGGVAVPSDDAEVGAAREDNAASKDKSHCREILHVLKGGKTLMGVEC